VLVVTQGCCPVLIPSCVRDVVVGVGLALALHTPVVVQLYLIALEEVPVLVFETVQSLTVCVLVQ